MNTNDGGTGSLRDAINHVNADTSSGIDTIRFAIPGGAQTIYLQSALPAITHAVNIDGASQTGFSGLPLIELQGGSAGANANGLTLSAGNSTVTSLAIDGFSGDGILLNG